MLRRLLDWKKANILMTLKKRHVILIASNRGHDLVVHVYLQVRYSETPQVHFEQNELRYSRRGAH